MKWIGIILSSIWKVWFYTTILIAILLLFPFLVIASITPKWYPQFFFLSRVWAWMVLILTGFWPKAVWLERPRKGEVYIICPNHTSMIDIMMTFALFPNCFLFIGKKELAKMPLFGYFYKRTNLLVDRQSLRSRKNVLDRAAKKVDEGIGICIYPEGGVPDEEVELAPFKPGAFRLAVEKNLKIIPVSYLDNKRHLPFDFHRGYPGVLRAVIHPFITPLSNDVAEIDRMKEECYGTIMSGLATTDLKSMLNEAE